MNRFPSDLAPSTLRQARPLRNVYGCLVHERPECVLDLVRNLHHLDPSSAILLYNGSDDPGLLDGPWPFERYGAVRHPRPRPHRWGRLHEFALDSLRFALERLPFDTFTIVDSDQLAVRRGYPARLAESLQGRGDIGLFGHTAGPQPRNSGVPTVRGAYRELDEWRPFLRRFPDGEGKFIHWTFWPGTVFTAPAAAALVERVDTDPELAGLLERTRIHATEEVLLPTLVALLGFSVATSPVSHDFVRFRSRYTLAQLDEAFAHPDVYWVHPIPRRYDHPLRCHVRNRHRRYGHAAERTQPAMDHPEGAPLLRVLPILSRMRRVEGWLEDDEADLLIAATARALGPVRPKASPAVVEVGSYCGRSTVVIGSTIRAVCPRARLFAIDPHEGQVGAAGNGHDELPTLERFNENVAAAGLDGVVVPIVKRSYEVDWGEPIRLMFIDGLHDYLNVARDFEHFERWLEPGGYVAFHDYAGYYPGVMAFVDELLARGRYHEVDRVRSLIVLQKEPTAPLGSPS